MASAVPPRPTTPSTTAAITIRRFRRPLITSSSAGYPPCPSRDTAPTMREPRPVAQRPSGRRGGILRHYQIGEPRYGGTSVRGSASYRHGPPSSDRHRRARARHRGSAAGGVGPIDQAAPRAGSSSVTRGRARGRRLTRADAETPGSSTGRTAAGFRLVATTPPTRTATHRVCSYGPAPTSYCLACRPLQHCFVTIPSVVSIGEVVRGFDRDTRPRAAGRHLRPPHRVTRPRTPTILLGRW